MGARSRGRSHANYSPGAPAQTKRSFESTTRFDSTATRASAGSNYKAVNAAVAGSENLLNIDQPRQLQPTIKHTVHINAGSVFRNVGT